MHFVPCKQTMNVNKTHQLTPGISAAIFGVIEPHYSFSLSKIIQYQIMLRYLGLYSQHFVYLVTHEWAHQARVLHYTNIQ